MARPANPQPGETRVNGDGARSVDPRANVLAPNSKYYPWQTDGRGWLDLPTNSGCITSMEKWEMLEDYQVAAMLHLRRSWILDEGVQIVPTVGVEPMSQYKVKNPRYERAVEAADLCRWMLANLAESFHDALMQWQQADFWRNMASELIWRDQEWGDYKGKLMLDRVPVYGPGQYTIWQRNGMIIGLQPAGLNGLDADGKPRVYPMEKFALYRFRVDPWHRYGTDLAPAIQLPHYMKREAQPEQLANLAQFGSPTVWGTGPQNVTGDVPLPSGLVDACGRTIPAKDSEGNVIMVPPHQAMAVGMSGIHAGSFIFLPGSSQLGLLEAQNGGRIFIDFREDCDWQIAVAILGTGTYTQEQRYGSNATSQTGQQVARTPVGSDKASTADLIRLAICTPAVRYNLKESYWDTVPSVTCGDPNKDVWLSLFTTLLNSMPAEQAFELVAHLARRVGVTDLDFIRMREMALNGEPLPGTVAGTGRQPLKEAA